MCERKNMFPEEFNPTFLFAWKGRKTGEREEYHVYDYLKLVFVISGRGLYRIEGKIYELTEGDVLILNPGVRHHAMPAEEGASPCVEFYIGANDFHVRDLPPNCLPVPAEGYVLHTEGDLRQRLERICAAMEAENAVYRRGRYYMMKSYLIQILLLLIREQYESEELRQGFAFESVNRKYVVEKIMDYFEEHYGEKISLDQIAENMYLSPYYISKIFKSETGEAPIRHLIDIRLSRAKELLENGWGGSIKEVAATVGYDDAYHFSKLFKKKYGISPLGVKQGKEAPDRDAPEQREEEDGQ